MRRRVEGRVTRSLSAGEVPRPYCRGCVSAVSTFAVASVTLERRYDGEGQSRRLSRLERADGLMREQPADKEEGGCT